MIDQTIDCPLCRYPLEICINWAQKNKRVFCGTCCRSFDVDFSSQPLLSEYEEDIEAQSPLMYEKEDTDGTPF